MKNVLKKPRDPICYSGYADPEYMSQRMQFSYCNTMSSNDGAGSGEPAQTRDARKLHFATIH